MNLFNNILMLTDSYKVSHYRQYPQKTSIISSYLESRGHKEYKDTVFFGLQYFLKQYLCKTVTQDMVEEAADFYKAHFGDPTMFNRIGWEHVVKEHGGRLPVKINAVPEGTVVPTHNVLMTIENTDPKCYWLTNWLETLLVNLWYPITVTSISRENKKVIAAALEESGDPAGLPFKLHDFGCRGVTCPEQAGLGGCAHLVNFMGTDTVPALEVARKIYGEEMAGFSIPAAEHSTITAWGKEHEVDAYRNMLKQYPEGLVAVVSDSYDIYNACKNLWGDKLKADVLDRKGTVVVRPDSGKATKVLPEVLFTLGQAFGYKKNKKGYKVLPDCIRVIQGDAVEPHTLPIYLNCVMDRGWSADNIAFGSGGGLLQKLNRDTYNFAFKCSYAVINGKGQDVYKSPVGSTWKGSKRGRLMLVEDSHWEDKKVAPSYKTVAYAPHVRNILEPVFSNGVLLREQTLKDIRERATL